MTTKEQERKALAQIKKIVDSLGENSYVATAFEGCFEDAEYNIENDFACSMKQRAESAEKKAARLEAENSSLKADLKSATEKAAKKQAELEEKNKKLEVLALGPDDLCDLEELVNERIYEADSKAKESAETIVTWADEPTSNAFINAVKVNRTMKERKLYYERIRDHIFASKNAFVALK